MRSYLIEANHDLLYQIEAVQELLGTSQVPGELTPYLGEVSLFARASSASSSKPERSGVRP